MVGGSWPVCIVMMVAATPAAPHAPWGCPICDFRADIGTWWARSSPSASLSARVCVFVLFQNKHPRTLGEHEAVAIDGERARAFLGRVVPAAGHDLHQHEA